MNIKDAVSFILNTSFWDQALTEKSEAFENCVIIVRKTIDEEIERRVEAGELLRPF
jgi:hypothetical protein